MNARTDDAPFSIDEQTRRTSVFEAHRSMLMGLAYRMTGSWADAEDVVQDTWMRWETSAPEQVASAWAWLARTASRLCLDLMKSARKKREVYTGPWLPEPVPDLIPGETAASERGSMVSYALLVVLERLSPLERAVYLLREVFEFPYGDIAEWLEIREDHARQVGRRARNRLGTGTPVRKAKASHLEELLNRFLRATHEGDLSDLLALFHHDVVMFADGGGKVPSALRPVYGSDRVSKFFVGLARKRSETLTHSIDWVNGVPAMIFREGRLTGTVLMLDVDGDRVRTVYVMRNPDKLELFQA